MFKSTLQQINNLTGSFHATRNFGKILEKISILHVVFFCFFMREKKCLAREENIAPPLPSKSLMIGS
jgi:hypothetical protein